MKNLESPTVDLIREMLPALDELIALLEYYDNATYRAAVQAIAAALQNQGLRSFDDKGLFFDAARHEVHSTHPKDNIDEPTVCRTHIRGYTIEDVILRKSIVDLFIPLEGEHNESTNT